MAIKKYLPADLGVHVFTEGGQPKTVKKWDFPAMMTVIVPGAYPGCMFQPPGELGRPHLVPALWGGTRTSVSLHPQGSPGDSCSLEPQPESVRCSAGYRAQGFR